MGETINPEAKNFVKTVMITATFGGLLFGYDTGVVNGALPFMAAPDQLNLTPQLEGFVVSALLVGATIGSVTGGRIADAMGRRKMKMLFGGICYRLRHFRQCFYFLE
ncbi:MAG: MFS transporter [Selenomonadaceae bacterium]|nr:MFS transporter [Selenomonadaceae bacterium]